MSKPGGTPIRLGRPFVDDSRVRIKAEAVDNRITAFEVEDKVKGTKKRFEVSKNKILDAWKQAQKFADEILS